MALGTLLTAINAMATAPPTEPATYAGFAPDSGTALELTVDPALAWNVFLGGTSYEGGRAVAVDAGGNVYVAGYGNGPWGEPIRPFVGSENAFVAKFDASGSLLWLTFLGGGVASGDIGYGIAVDAGGSTYVTGTSAGSWGAPINDYAGGGDTFVAKLDTSGALLWNTFLGGTGNDAGRGIAVDASGNVSVTGRSDSSWGTPVRPWQGFYDAFVARLDADGTLLWNTFLGGGVVSGYHTGYAVAADPGGSVLVTGDSNMPWGAPIGPWSGLRNAFIAKIDGDGALVWNTFLGGNEESGFGIAVDASGGIVVTGSSSGRSWGAPIRPMGAYGDAFVAKLDAGGTLAWNTFLGGDQGDVGKGIAVNMNGDIFVLGDSGSNWGAPPRAFTAFMDPFVAKLDAGGALLWNTFLGGASWDYGYGIAVDADGNAYATGSSQAAWGTPITPWAGHTDLFLARIGNSANTAPFAFDQEIGTLEQTATAITLSATDADLDPLTFFVVAFPAHGVLGGSAPDLTYQPAPGFTGPDSLTFRASDGVSTATSQR